MTIAVSNFPFRKWVSRPLGIFVIVFLFLPVLFINGTYTTNIGEITSSLGIISEHIQFANFATAVGMTVFTPFIRRYLEIRRPKMVFISGFILLILFSYLCAKTISIPFLIVCSFLTGFVRMALIFNLLGCYLQFVSKRDMTKGMKPYPVPMNEEALSKIDRRRTFFLTFLYLFFLSVSQLGSFVTAYLAYSYEWQYVYYFMMGLALLGLLLAEVTMVYQTRLHTARLSGKKFGDVVLASLMLLSFSFILIYGKTMDWFHSSKIMLATCVFLVAMGSFILLEFHTKRTPYFNFKVFTKRNMLMAAFLFILGMALNGSSMLVSAFSGLSMSLDNLQNAQLSNWMWLGYLAGTILTFLMVKWKIPFRYLFLVSFSLMTLAAVYVYFHVQSTELYPHLILPVVVRSAGMIICYGMATALGMTHMNPSLHNSFLFVMLTMRSIVGPVSGISVYSNALYEKQNYYVSRLSQDVDMLNPQASASFVQAQRGAMAQGKSYEDAQILASKSVAGHIQAQSTLAALKEIAGWTVWAGIGCIVVVGVLPYPKKRG